MAKSELLPDVPSARILYMEDDPGLARVVQKRLQRAGYAVDVACDGQEGLALYDVGSYDVVAIDQTMPVYDGLEVIRRLASRGSLPLTIMITGGGDPKVAAEAIELGASEYIVKDLGARYLDLLPSVIERLLHQRRLTREREEALEALRESEARYRSLFEGVPVGLYTATSEGKILEANSALAEMLGYEEPSALLGRNVLESYVYTEAADATGARQRWQDLVGCEGEARGRWRYQGREVQWRRRDGTLIWVQESARAICDSAGKLLYYEGAVVDITERRRTEEALRESEVRYRTLVEQIPAIIYITSFTEPSSQRALTEGASTQFYFSPQIERILGYSQSEWMNGPQLWLKHIHPDDRMRVLAELAHSHDSGEPFSSEYRMLPAASTTARDDHERLSQTLWFRDEAMVVRDDDGNPLFLQGVMFDITERRQAEHELQQRLDELALLNSASRVMVSSLDLETVMEATMRQAIEVLEVEAGSVLLLDPNTGELVFEAASGGGAAGLRGRRLPPGQGVAGWVAQHGEPLIVPDVRADERFYSQIDAGSGFITRSILCVPLFYRGQIIGVMQALNKIGRKFRADDLPLLEALASTAAIAIENAQLYEKVQRELRERVRAEEELREERANLARRVTERTAELSAANAELARAARLKDEFLASVSHELRTPLNAILGLSEALQEQVYGPLNERQLRSLHSIEESGRVLLSLINDILDVSKIEAGKLELDMGPVAVESVCQASLGLIKQLAHKKRLRVSSTFDSGVERILGDSRRIKQVLVNLLSNAVKFTPEGGAIGLEVIGDAEQEVVRFTVWDTGIGISREGMARLFQPFVQLDSSLSRQYAGTGLGLALVRRLTELHGGGVSVESEKGKGSRFTVSLPWREPIERHKAQAQMPSPSDLVPAAFHPSSLPPLVLLAEDSEANITTLSDYLLSKGCRLTIARNGLEAIERAREERPDIILMDIQMPEMDGLEATRRLRADSDLRTVPIVVLTALAMPGDRERCLEAGANAYLSKPVSLKQLVDVVKVQLNADT